MSETNEIAVIEPIDGFFFKDGQIAFNKLVEFANKNTYLLNTAWEEFKDYNGSISEWIKDDDKKKNKKDKDNIIKLLNAINEFVSYCDVNALSKDSKGVDFQGKDKKTIAKAFVFQYNWVRNIIKYLMNESSENIAYSVQKAIDYFKSPNDKFNILSKEHRKKISLHYLKKELDDSSFDEDLKTCLNIPWNNIQSETENNVDLTYNYTNKIYEKTERSQWDCKVDTTLLEKNRNLILTGAPGTGKTFLARQMAEKLTKNNTPQINDEKENNPYIGFVQFHPSYDYTDFVEGLRPKACDNNIVFERVNGVFKEFCKKAIENEKDKKEDDKNKYVFIIDEINRGEISKIFGELFFSIDPGYRGKKGIVKTQYQNMITDNNDPFKEGFYVPDNVYIIGTMNDIDRSVESMDFAFRRRFAFQEITAEDTMDSILYQLGDDETIAINKMRAINNTLDKLGLNSNYHIGAAYFMKAQNYLGRGNKATDNTWKQLWDLHLKGTLFEYFRGEPEANENLKRLKKAYDNAGEN